MATNPFANVGLDMFGNELGGLPGPSQKDNGNPLGTLATMFAKYLGGSQNPDQYSIAGAVPPIGDTSLPSMSVVPPGVSGPGIKPTSSTMGISPYAQSTGLNMFTRMPNDLQKNMTYNPVTMQIWGNQNAD
jgi:hypothetical protein